MEGTEFYQPNRVLLLIREELKEGIIRPPMTSLLLGTTLKVTSARLRSPNKRSLLYFTWRTLSLSMFGQFILQFRVMFEG